MEDKMQHFTENIQVDILLGVYNGARFLPELVDSIFTQSHQQFRIIARDDGSTDASPEILKSIAFKNPDRFILLPGNRHLGTLLNYSELMKQAAAPYIMFCDQDDCWLPDKIEATLKEMKEAEYRHGSKSPLLVHTDLMVVDEARRVLDRSFWHYQHLNPSLDSFNRLLVQNVVTGCTVMINRPLLLLSPALPEGALVHDWWLALVAAAFGHISCLERPTIQYRQHAGNWIGAEKWGVPYILDRMNLDTLEASRLLRRTYRQARVFHDTYADRLRPEHREAATALARFEELGFLQKRFAMLRHGLLKQGLLRNIGFFMQA